MKLLLATKNKGKQQEISEIFQQASLPVEIVSLDDIAIDVDIEESEATLEGNALKKARAYAKTSGLITLADDTGIEIDAFDGAPGIYARRYPNMVKNQEGDASDQEIINYWTDQFKSLDQSSLRGGRYRSVICLYDPQNDAYMISSGSAEFELAETPSSTVNEGFPYDSLFLDPSTKTHLSELPLDKAQGRSHRRKATQALIDLIKRLEH